MKLAPDKISELCDEYKTRKFSKKALCNKYGVTFSTLSKYLKTQNIYFISKYGVNETYFNKIDTEDKAYFLGLMYADGTNIEKRNAVAICLQERDKNILEIFREKISLDKPLTFVNRKKESETFQNQWRLNIINKNISKKLASLGCWANKSMTLVFPSSKQVPNNLLRHFIRGIWDGDGHIGLYKRRSNNQVFCDVSLTSTKMFCDELSLLLNNRLSINTCIIAKNRSKITKQLHVNSISQSLKFLNWIYSDATIYLDRKYNKYQEIKTYYEKK